MPTDPARYRQSLVDALTDDGLEELTLRLVRPEYPQARRSGRGKDGSIDVLSDLELPPARAWQCKNRTSGFWDSCRESLSAAMGDDHPPPHYTFVFPRPLTGPQRDFWRKDFLPEQRELYPDLQTLDYCDNLAVLLEDRPELINRLNEGALASSYRDVATAANQTGVNPLASIPDLIGDAPGLARRAVETGRTDPRYRYENRQREARADDRTIPEGRVRFGFEAPIGRPRKFTAAIRTGDAVEEKAAELREDVSLDQVTPWFSNTPDGHARRDYIRGELAAGRPVDFTGDPDGGLRSDTRPGWNQGLYAFMRRVLATDPGRELYSLRKQTIEPVFGQIKHNRRLDRFLLRGRAAVRSEWRMIAATHNLLKLHQHWITPATG